MGECFSKLLLVSKSPLGLQEWTAVRNAIATTLSSIPKYILRKVLGNCRIRECSRLPDNLVSIKTINTVHNAI